MADVVAHNPAEPRPEDAPSIVEHFVEGPGDGSDRGGPGGGNDRGGPGGGCDRGGPGDGGAPHPEDAPSEVEMFDEEPDGGGPAPRGGDAGRPNPHRNQSPEDDAASDPEDAPSEVELFDEGLAPGAPPPRRPAAGERHPPRRPSRNRARNPPRRASPVRAQSPRIRDFGDEAIDPPRPKTIREQVHDRRARRDGYARTKERRQSTRDELLPNEPDAKYNRAVESIRRKVYRVPKEDREEPIDDGCYRWFVRGYVREHSNERPKRQIIVEDGPRRVVAMFDEETPNSNVHTWVAEKILEETAGGRPAPHPSEMRVNGRNYDSGICCSIS